MNHKIITAMLSLGLLALLGCRTGDTSKDGRSGQKYDAIVAADGSGNFTTVQAAVAAAPANGDKPFVILLKPGKYDGQIIVPADKPFIRLVGVEATNTVLTYPFNVYEGASVTNPKFRGIGVVVLGNDFSAENVTFENTSGDHGQALALRVIGDRAVFKHCRMLGWQDTLRVDDHRQYFTNCYVEGRVDFIYGSGTAVFDHCTIHSKNGGYVTAANTPENTPFGFVFLDCRLTGDPTPWMNPTNPAAAKPARKPLADLGRPWRAFASVAFVRCEMGDHIRPAGWNNWGDAAKEQTARYAEYHSTGPGANPPARVPWAKQLTDEEARAYTVENILKGADGWNPADAR